MKAELVPLLHVQRELLGVPRGMERFRAYIRSVRPEGSDEIAIPMVAFNPMSREHVAAVVEHLLTVRAEDAAADALREAQERLDTLPDVLKVGLVVADDAAGGWTDRYLNDFTYRFARTPKVAAGWATVVLWSSERPTADDVRREVLSTVYRVAYRERKPPPATLRAMLRQETLAASFGGGSDRRLDADDLAYTREAIVPYLDAADRPKQFACLYGDDAARSVGYEPLGFSPWAGLALAGADGAEADAVAALEP